jgi:hypothetical protein
MVDMRSRFFFRSCVLPALLVLLLSSLTAGAQQKSSNRGRKFKMPPPTARIEVTVVRDVDGKPIENSAVIFHAMEGEKDRGNMELKTNENGRAVIDVMPIGDVMRLQVIAKGYQTFGDDYKVDKDRLSIAIRLKRPGEPYSVYKKHPDTLRGGKSTNDDVPASPSAGTAENANASEAAGSASEPAPASKDNSEPGSQSVPSQSQAK